MKANYTSEELKEYLVENFDKAIEQGWIETYFQPVVRTSNGKVCEEEVLARWNDPQYGLLEAGSFVPILEKTNLIEKMDLYVLGRVLSKIRQQKEKNIYVVTNSVNFSKVDFHTGNIVEQVEKLVSAEDIERDKIAIEVPECSVIKDSEHALSQLQRLQELGYKIELDDYGSNDISLLISSNIHFDSVKINRNLTSQIMTNKNARVILSELVKMSTKMGIETAVKGVETTEQLDFLKEIGCPRLQGFYYLKPISTEQLFARYRTGKQIGFENPDESGYYSAVDKISLHDISFIREHSGLGADLYDALPMAILEVEEDKMNVMRINKSCVEFILTNFPDLNYHASINLEAQDNMPGSYTLSAIRRCSNSDELVVIDDRTPGGKNVHIMLQKVANNPVNGKIAVLFAVVSINEIEKTTDALSYNYIARALSEDYVALYFVDTETNNYVEYYADGTNRDVSIESQGDDFFADATSNSKKLVYEEDMELFREMFTKENIMRSIDEHGMFSITYRADDDRGVHYISTKAVRAKGDNKHIIIGVNDVDNQIKQQQLFTRIKEERVVYSRIAALAGDFLAVYSVDLIDDSYVVYKTPQGMNFIGKKEKGNDFFTETFARIKEIIVEEDLPAFVQNVNKEYIIKAINRKGYFEYRYRLKMAHEPIYVEMKAVILNENNDAKLIVGIINIDAQVKKDEEYAENLSAAEDMAFKDELTGVKNKHAYALAEKELEEALEADEEQAYAIVMFDLNGLKFINDTFGHQEGDEYIKRGCNMICEVFAHSPVYRIGGDEFTVIAQGRDYIKLDSCMAMIDLRNNANRIKGDVTIAAGMARGQKGLSVNEVFKQADENMYKKKSRMKAMEGLLSGR